MSPQDERFIEEFERWHEEIQPRLAPIDRELRWEGELSASAGLTAGRVVTAGAFIVEIDRELRRSVALVRGNEPMARGQEGRLGIPPISPNVGDLELRHAESGSLQFLLEPYGLVPDVMLFEPLQVLLGLAALYSGAGRVRAWVSRGGKDQHAPEQQVLDSVDIDIPDLARFRRVPSGAYVTLEKTRKHPDGSEEKVAISVDFSDARSKRE